MNIWDILRTYSPGLLSGLKVTAKVAAIVWATGLIIGTLVAVAQARFPKIVGIPLRVLAFIISSLPVLVLLFWLHYPVQSIFGVIIDPFYTTVVTLSLVNVFAVSEIVRPALASFPSGLLASAKVSGLSARAIFRHVQLPFVARQVAPALLGLQVVMLQATIFGSLISLDEIFRVAQRINAQIYQPVHVYTALGLFFIAICLPLNAASIWLNRRFRLTLSVE